MVFHSNPYHLHVLGDCVPIYLLFIIKLGPNKDRPYKWSLTNTIESTPLEGGELGATLNETE